MSINNSYNEEAIVKAIAVALDNFYTNLIKKIDSLNIKAVMKRKNPYVDDFDTSYQKASNRLVREFTQQFCFEDGSIDWEKLVKFDSGN